MTRPADRPAKPGVRRSGRERRARERRVLLLGLGLSLVVHLVAIVLVSQWLTPGPDGEPPRPDAMVIEPPLGMRAVEIQTGPELTDPTEPERPDPRAEPVPRPSTEREVVVRSEGDADSVTVEVLTAAERLSPRIVDPRLWRPLVIVPGEVTFQDVEARIAAAVELMSDSALAAADAAIRARDWTVEDAKGGKWGISPGKIHLGSVVLPLPIFAVATPDQVEANALWYEVDQQFERALILESFEERVRAIRERRERERGGARSGDNGSG